MPKPKSPTPVHATKHKDKRANIPTEELRDFVADAEKAPKKTLYPRDPSLDPQLVWKGKDEQDREPLEVPAVPNYIPENIHPQVIIENLRAHPPVAADVRRLTSKKRDQSLVTSAATPIAKAHSEFWSLLREAVWRAWRPLLAAGFTVAIVKLFSDECCRGGDGSIPSRPSGPVKTRSVSIIL
jgi:hypothetical protein